MAVFLSNFLISLKENRPEHSCFSSMWHLETVCKDIDTQSQAFSFSRSEYLTQPIQMQLSPNQKIFCEFIFCISTIYIQFEILWKRRWPSEVISFSTYRQQNAGLLKCQESPVSKHYWTVNMLKGLEHFTNLHSSIFLWFFEQCEKESARKNLF